MDTSVNEQQPKARKNRSRKGKGAQQKSTDAYRTRMNEQVSQQFYSTVKTKLGLIEADTTEMIHRSISLVPIFPAKYAIPFSISTRGVGVSTALWYNTLMEVEGLDDITPICSIHQAFRVHLSLHMYKMFLAQEIQTEPSLVARTSLNITLTSSMKDILNEVTVVPSVFAIVLECTGKVSFNDEVYHSVYPVVGDAPVANSYLVLNTVNIRNQLTFLADIDTPRALRDAVSNMLCVPGTRFNANMILQNLDEIWPASYDDVALRNDITAYKRLISMTRNGLRKSFYSNITWSGNADVAMVVSTRYQATLHITSMFSKRARSIGVTTRQADGTLVEEATQESESADKFESCSIVGADNSLWWSRRKLNQMSTSLGVAAMVGEMCDYLVRDEGNCLFSTTMNCVEILSIFSVSR